MQKTELITREIYWNIGGGGFPWAQLFMYGLTFLAIGLFARGLIKSGFTARMKMWKLAARPEENPLKPAGLRFVSALAELLSHKKIFEKPFMGLVHYSLFWGFIILVIATALVFIQADGTHAVTS